MDSEGQSLLWLALLSQQSDVAKMLVDAGSFVDLEDDNKETLLHRSIVFKDSESTLFLLQNGANINKRFVFVFLSELRLFLSEFSSLPR